MPHRGKRYLTASKLVDRTKQYDPKEALALLMEMAKAKFDETVEAHIRLGIDPRRSDQQVRGAVVHRTEQARPESLVFAKGEKIREPRRPAQTTQAGRVGRKDQRRLDGLRRRRRDADMMGTVGKLGKILGPGA